MMADATCRTCGCSALAVRGMNCPEHAKEREAIKGRIAGNEHWLLMFMGVDNLRNANIVANGSLARYQSFCRSNWAEVVRYRELMGLESPPGFLEEQYEAYMKVEYCQKDGAALT